MSVAQQLDPFPPPARPGPDEDQRVFLRPATWDDYEILLAMRQERQLPRMTFFKGVLELMSPSIHHEGFKTLLARLIEAYTDEQGLECNGFGSWTLKNRAAECGLEPDECYYLGAGQPERPDLALEVVWTSGGLNKLDIYRALGVREVWIWRQAAGDTDLPGRLQFYVLRDQGYVQVARSELLPELDPELLARCFTLPSQSQAVRAFRAELRNQPH